MGKNRLHETNNLQTCPQLTQGTLQRERRTPRPQSGFLLGAPQKGEEKKKKKLTNGLSKTVNGSANNRLVKPPQPENVETSRPEALSNVGVQKLPKKSPKAFAGKKNTERKVFRRHSCPARKGGASQSLRQARSLPMPKKKPQTLQKEKKKTRSCQKNQS